MEKLWHLKDAASRVGVSHYTLRRWAKLGRVGSVKLSARSIKFRESDLEALVRSHERPVNATK